MLKFMKIESQYAAYFQTYIRIVDASPTAEPQAQVFRGNFVFFKLNVLQPDPILIRKLISDFFLLPKNDFLVIDSLFR